MFLHAREAVGQGRTCQARIDVSNYIYESEAVPGVEIWSSCKQKSTIFSTRANIPSGATGKQAILKLKHVSSVFCLHCHWVGRATADDTAPTHPSHLSCHPSHHTYTAFHHISTTLHHTCLSHPSPHLSEPPITPAPSSTL